ncbi:MAG TPA: hypothetical protein PLI20_01850, partial [Bacillota bacterium]|nr:hypothetical protein [Bacillota bacterium]
IFTSLYYIFYFTYSRSVNSRHYLFRGIGLVLGYAVPRSVIGIDGCFPGSFNLQYPSGFVVGSTTFP